MSADKACQACDKCRYDAAVIRLSSGYKSQILQIGAPNVILIRAQQRHVDKAPYTYAVTDPAAC